MQIELILKKITKDPKSLSPNSCLIVYLFMDENKTCASRFIILIYLMSVNTY